MRKSAVLFAVILCLSASRLVGQISVIGELSQDREATPGETYTGSIIVRNDSNELQEAKAYQTDYLFHFDGTNEYGDAGSHARSNGKWVSFSPAQMVLPPQTTITINYRVTVPPETAGKKFIGTYWSMLMVEAIPSGSAASTLKKPKKTEMGITQTIRYGIQIATHIANTGTKKIRFVNVQVVKKEKGERILQVDVENTGEVGIRPDVYTELFDNQGKSLGKFSGNKYRIYPGTSVRQLIDISKVAPGTYKAIIVVDAGGEDIFGANYTLKL
jgi:hypothetical protein